VRCKVLVLTFGQGIYEAEVHVVVFVFLMNTAVARSNLLEAEGHLSRTEGLRLMLTLCVPRYRED
jgi:hypothetical protein